MLTVSGPALYRPRRLRRRGERIAWVVSALLHASVVALLLLHLAPGRLPAQAPPIEIELVQQMAQVRGAAPPQPEPKPTVEPQPTTPAAPTPAAPPPAAPPTVAASPELAPTPPAPPSKSTPSAPSASSRPPTPRAPTPAPEINLGNASRDLEALTVTGDNVVPPEPNARYRNKPPFYPPDAAREGAQGTVQLVAHVSAFGLPLSITVAVSSGNASLDAEARRAVSLWHFNPARVGGDPVPYDYVVNIRFALGDR